MSRRRTAIAAGALCTGAAIVWFALPAMDAEAVAGGGKRDIGVRVVGRNLVLVGARNKQVSVSITPTRNGLRLRGGRGTRLNKTEGPIRLGRITGKWILDFHACAGADISILPPEDGVAPLRVNTIAIRGPIGRTTIDMDGVRVRRDVKLALRRSSGARGNAIDIINCQIAGRLQVRQGDRASDIYCRNTTIGKFAKIVTKSKNTIEDQSAHHFFDHCELESLRILGSTNNPVTLHLTETAIRGSVQLTDRVDLDATDTTIGGDLVMTVFPSDRTISLTRVTVEGAASIRTGPGNDTLTTIGTSVGDGSFFDASSGEADTWFTDDDALIETTNVENFGPPPTEE